MMDRYASCGPDPLVLQLVDWAAQRPRIYGEAMEAWRTSCPRLTVWEDALAARLIDVTATPGGGLVGARVLVTDAGHAALERNR